MTRFKHYGKLLLIAFILLVIAYLVAAQFVPPVILAEFSFAFGLTFWLAKSFVFLRELWLRDKDYIEFSQSDLVMISFSCVGLAMAVETGSRLWSRLQDTVLDDAAVGFYRTITLFFVMILISLRGTPHYPSKLWDWTSILWVAIAAGAAIFAYVLYDRLWL